MTPEQERVTREWITVFEEAVEHVELHMREHPSDMEDPKMRLLLEAQRNQALSMAEDLRNQLKEGDVDLLIWAVWADTNDTEPFAYCLSKATADIVYDSIKDSIQDDLTKGNPIKIDSMTGGVVPYWVTWTAWAKLHTKTAESD